MYVPFGAMIERSQITPFWAAHPNFLSEGCRCCFDKEVGLDRTYLTYFLFSPTIEMQQILPYHKKLHYLNIPVVYILNTTVLDTLEVIVHLLASLTYLHTEVVSNTVVKIVESTDR